jgi:chorismate mutase
VKGGGLGGARAEIDKIDAALLRLLNRRAAVVTKVHAAKARRGEAFYDAARTDAILARLRRLNRGPLRDDQVLALFTFLLHHFALGHRPGRPPKPPHLLAEVAPGADRALLRRHGLKELRKGSSRRGLLDARAVAGARGLLLRIAKGEDEEALARLCHRAKLLWLGGR